MFGKHKTLKILTFVFALGLFVGLVKAADIKDSDLDGITDESETMMYKTDPTNPDTDGDGFFDLQEIQNGSDPLVNLSTPVKKVDASNIRLLDKYDPIAWYIARISGIVAFILLSLTVSFGLLQTSRALVKIRIIGTLTAQEVHRAIAWAGLIMVVVHFTSLMFDTYFIIKPLEIVVPFLLQRPFTSTMGYEFRLPVAIGIISFYTILLLIITSEFRNKIVSMKVWRTIHYVSFLGYLMFVAHGFMAGTESKEPWMQAIYIGSLSIVLTLLLARIFKKQLFLPKIVKAAPQAQQSTPADVVATIQK